MPLRPAVYFKIQIGGLKQARLQMHYICICIHVDACKLLLHACTGRKAKTTALAQLVESKCRSASSNRCAWAVPCWLVLNSRERYNLCLEPHAAHLPDVTGVGLGRHLTVTGFDQADLRC
jgi:hypothetical protein